jgi:3,4-dihydroxy-2-butanone 4-phosphate synthase
MYHFFFYKKGFFMTTTERIEQAVEHFARGGMVIVMDDEDRENEGDLFLAAEFATPEKINFIIRNTSGILAVPMTKKRTQELDLPLMTTKSKSLFGLNFTVSCDYKTNSTGVSAQDRSDTIRALSDENVTASDFCKPGHIFPIIANEEGLNKRKGHTEASVTLCAMAHVKPVAVIGELMNPNGTMMRYDACVEFGKKYSMPVITIEQMTEYLTERGYLNLQTFMSMQAQI